jgi:restriction system protein
VAGTLLARGVPHGIIISTRSHFSSDAVREAQRISERIVKGVGRLTLSLLDYHSLLDMLEMASIKLGNSVSPEKRIPREPYTSLFDGIYHADNPSRD